MAARRSFHEDLGREATPEAGSIGSFALVMAVALPLLAWLLPGGWWSILLLAAALIIALLWWLVPRWLVPLNRAWFRFGLLLGRVVTPLVMGVVFFGVVTPIGLIRRVLAKDSLGLDADSSADSYWIPRDPPGPEPEHIRRQF
jgi:hypothetical protein